MTKIITISSILAGFASLVLIGSALAYDHKVDVCHCPAGDLDKCFTLTVGEAAAEAHLLNHTNDSAGACPDCRVDADCEEPQCDGPQKISRGVCEEGSCLTVQAQCPPDSASAACLECPDGSTACCQESTIFQCNPETVECERTFTSNCPPVCPQLEP